MSFKVMNWSFLKIETILVVIITILLWCKYPSVFGMFLASFVIIIMVFIRMVSHLIVLYHRFQVSEPVCGQTPELCDGLHCTVWNGVIR